MNSIANLMVVVGADLSKFQREMAQTKRSLDKTARQFKDVGTTLTTSLTLPIVGAGAAAIKTSMDLESAFTGVVKTVDATEQELAGLKKGFENMSREIPIATTELYGIGEAAGQLGIKTENILGFSETMAKLGVTTNLSSDEAATALARLANITQMPQTEFDKLGSTIVALGNNLATTEAEIVEMGLRVAGAGSQVGMTEAQILAFSGALSSVGIAAEAGGSAISKLMINIASEVATGGKKLSGFAKVSGMSASEFQKAWKEDASLALVAFIEGLGRMKESGGNVFGVLDQLGLSEIRVRDALLRASGAGDLFRQSLELGTEAWAENNALNKEAELRFGTTAAQIQLMKNNLVLLADSFGSIFMPVVNSAIQGLIPFLNAITGLSEGKKRLIVTIALLVAAIGPLLLIIGQGISVFGAVAGVLGITAGALGTMIGVVGAVVIAIVALITIFKHLWETNEEFRVIVTAIWQEIYEFGVTLFTLLGETLSDIWNGLKDVFIGVFDAIKIFWEVWGGLITAIAVGAWDQIKIVITTAINLIKDTIGFVLAVIRGDWGEAWERMKSITTTILDAISKTFKNFVNTIIRGINWIISGFNSIQVDIPAWVPKVGGRSFGISIPKVPLLGDGGIVMAPTLAMIGERGPEAVIPLNSRNNPVYSDSRPIIIYLDGKKIYEGVDGYLGSRLVGLGAI